MQREERPRPAGMAGHRRVLFGAALALLTTLAACGYRISVEPIGNGNSNTNGNDNSPEPTPPPIVTLRLANTTGAVLEAQVHVSSNGMDSTAETLFVEANEFTEGIGLAGSGLLTPMSADRAEIPCGKAMVIGTSGGLFLDDESGEELGSGQPRILQQGLVFDCGAEITFVYSEESGEFTVGLTLDQGE